MAGRIRDEDIAAVRERANIADVIGEHVQLRNAGGGNLKGICPFHDEKSPSLSVSPARNLYHCFGCGASGDVITFVQEIDHIPFVDAVEVLAAKAGIQLRYVDGGSAPSRPSGQRARLVEVHTVAAAFYAEQLATPDARTAREFLDGRGFDAAVAERFRCGYAPGGWDQLTKHLLGRGFKNDELVLAGLSRESNRGGLIDRFHRRLLWPIADISGDIVGFGARRLYDDDRIEAKYLNTPETPIYKKSQLLYGIDIAKKQISQQHQVVVVEGYTDVMACHLAGVTTAVASCGTAFGTEHVSALRRLTPHNDAAEALGVKVVFCFDGDAAGQKAAQRAFADEQKIMASTLVAVERHGKDPCELRQSDGDAAVRSLIDGAVPLVQFMLATIVKRYDVDTVEGRVAALDQAIPLVAGIKDHGMRDEYARRLSGMVGIDDPIRVVNRVRGLVRKGGARPGDQRPPAGADRGSPGALPVPEPAVVVPPRVAEVEREAVKAVLQFPGVVRARFDELDKSAFLVPVHQQIHAAVVDCGGAAAAEGRSPVAWIEEVGSHLPPDSAARSTLSALGVEPLKAKADAQPRYAAIIAASLTEQVVSRQHAQLKSRLQRLDADADADEVGRIYGELMRLEILRRQLRAESAGEE